MLVGAGGNAGNQAAVNVIRILSHMGSTTNNPDSNNQTTNNSMQNALKNNSFLSRVGVTPHLLSIFLTEVRFAFILGVLMVMIGFIRVFIFELSLYSAFSISLSLFFIVSISIILGAFLPILLYLSHMDPAHAGPIIQVVMDIVGVALTCFICSMLLG
jgi:Mg/Co/Ni transporter MgtE